MYTYSTTIQIVIEVKQDLYHKHIVILSRSLQNPLFYALFSTLRVSNYDRDNTYKYIGTYIHTVHAHMYTLRILKCSTLPSAQLLDICLQVLPMLSASRSSWLESPKYIHYYTAWNFIKY